MFLFLKYCDSIFKEKQFGSVICKAEIIIFFFYSFFVINIREISQIMHFLNKLKKRHLFVTFIHFQNIAVLKIFFHYNYLLF